MLHEIKFNEDLDDALRIQTIKVTGSDSKEYYQNSTFSIVTNKLGFWVLNNMTNCVTTVKGMSYDNAKGEREYQLQKRGMSF